MKIILFNSFFLLNLISTYCAQNIFEASRQGNLKRLTELEQLKHDTINSINENGFTPLILACYHNQLEAVKLLIDKGVNLNVNSPEGTALLAAVYKNNFTITSLLIKNNADINLCNIEGVTALMFAVMSGDINMVNLLINGGANTKLLSKQGQTALGLAKKYEFKQIEMLLSK